MFVANDVALYLCVTGAVLTGGAMVSAAIRRTPHVLLRRTLQRSEDYTRTEWRIFRLGNALIAFGLLLLIVAETFK